MKKFQVLIAAMKQNDFSLPKKMNLRCHSVIGNQTDYESIDYHIEDDVETLMVSTNTLGIGKNRNIAMDYSDAELILFADDDMLYYDSKLQGVIEAFEEFPDADIIIFSLDYKKDDRIYRSKHLDSKPLKFRNSLRYGAAVIAARRASIKGIRFNEYFGGGCIYSSGEDSLFIKACFDKKLKIYTHSYLLGSTCKDKSSWFEGYNEKFFYDKGALMRYLFPKMSIPMTLVFAMRFNQFSPISFFKRIKLMMSGRKYSGQLMSYNEYLMRNHE